MYTQASEMHRNVLVPAQLQRQLEINCRISQIPTKTVEELWFVNAGFDSLPNVAYTTGQDIYNKIKNIMGKNVCVLVRMHNNKPAASFSFPVWLSMF